MDSRRQGKLSLFYKLLKNKQKLNLNIFSINEIKNHSIELFIITSLKKILSKPLKNKTNNGLHKIDMFLRTDCKGECGECNALGLVLINLSNERFSFNFYKKLWSQKMFCAWSLYSYESSIRIKDFLFYL